MTAPRTHLVLGATGRTGRPFVDLALERGDRVRALVRDPSRLPADRRGLEVRRGATDDAALDLDALLDGVDDVVVLLGDVRAQQHAQVNSAFVRRLVPAMRRRGVTTLLYQAGGFSAPPGRRLPLPLRLVRATLAREYLGQHRDNEAVMRFLADEAPDLDWVVHRAALRPGAGSRGTLQRSRWWLSVATFQDCADYSLRLLSDAGAVHTCDGSRYVRR